MQKVLEMITIKIPTLKLVKTKKIAVISLLSLGIFIVLLAASYFIYREFSKEKIAYGVAVDGLDVSGLTQAQAKTKLDSRIQQILSSQITIDVGDSEKNVKFSDIGVDFKSAETINQVFDYNHNCSFINCFKAEYNSYFNGRKFNILTSINDEKLSSQLNAVGGNLIKEAKNSTIRVTNNQLEIVPEEWGQQTDVISFKNDLFSYINNGQKDSLAIGVVKVEPAIKSWQVYKILGQSQAIISPQIVLIDEDKNNPDNTKKYYAEKTEIASWITLKALNNGDLTVTFSQGEIKSFIEQIAKKTDQKMVKKRINQEDNSVISEGQDGRSMDQSKAYQDIMTILNARLDHANYNSSDVYLVINFTPKEEIIVPKLEANLSGGTPGMFEGKYIEINLTEQRMYTFEGSNLINSYIVSTGKWSMPTPTGVFYIQDKTARAWSNKYKLYMPWWNSIGGSYGIHELPEWPNGYKEGEAHLGTPVSHGCIRLGVGSAEEVYNWAPIGTAVNIHK